jgi:hypothetical protein
VLIGIDFDNTIAGYDDVFAPAGQAEDLLPPGFGGSKREIRDYIRTLENGERCWMALQGRVYGAHMSKAVLIDGVGGFLTRCRDSGIAVCIVSHKTRYGHFDPDKVDLREAALSWMEAQAFFDPAGFAVARNAVHFAETRTEKVARIATLGCTHFIDDLKEVFLEEAFPGETKQYLLSTETPAPQGPFEVFPGWSEITDALFRDLA